MTARTEDGQNAREGRPPDAAPANRHTEDGQDAREGRPPDAAPARRRRPPRVVAFVLLCAASLALAAGYAWWSAARRASFVQQVSLPPIGSLAELDARPALDTSAPPTGGEPATPAGEDRTPVSGAGQRETTVASGELARPAPAPHEGGASTPPAGEDSAPSTDAGSASSAGEDPALRPSAPRDGLVAPRSPTARPSGDRFGVAGRSAPTAHADPAANTDSPPPGVDDPRRGAGGPPPDVDGRGTGRDLLFRHTALDESFGVASVERPGAGGRRATPLRCDRVDFAGERGVCLTTDRFYTTHAIMVFDGAFRPLHRLPLHGVPSRVRLAPDGRLAAATVFVSGHSYLDEGFSTETSIIDTWSGERRIANLEELSVYRDGALFRAVDFNFWGVTFAADSDRFYATLGTGGTTYLVEGRVSTRRADVVVEGVECPSLSPDQRRLAFKKRLPLATGLGWRLHVLDLQSRAVTPLAERRSVDDQAEWLDDSTILYALPDPSAPTPMVTDVWRVPADGGGAPELVLAGASSPAVLRRDSVP